MIARGSYEPPYQTTSIRSIPQMIGQCLRNIFGSGLLTIAGIVLLISSLISIIACILPFWFKLTVWNQKFNVNDPGNNITVDTGLYFMDKEKFINLLAIDKASSVQLMPDYLKFAQLMFLVGTIGIIMCCASTILLLVRDKVVVSAEMGLCGATVAFALCQVLGIVLCVLQLVIDNRAMWQDLPVKDAFPNRFGYYKILEAYPTVEINWGFFFGIIAAFFSFVSAVIVCLQMFMSCRQLEAKRYQMLREKPDDGFSPIPGYPYYANKGYTRQPGEFVL